MPGILQLLYWISQLQCFCGELTLKSGTFWKEIFFGITFPVSIVFRFVKLSNANLLIEIESRLYFCFHYPCIKFFNHITATSLRCFPSRLGAPCIEKNYAQLRVLRSLQTFAESVPQILLQTYILLRTWQGFGENN